MSKAKDKHPTTQVTMVVEHIKQDPGAVQVTCSVYVNVPGKHFPNLSAAEEAGSAGPVLIACMVKVHYNWKYIYLRPTVKQVIERYNKKFRPTMYAKMQAAATASAAAAAAAAVAAAAAAAGPSS